MNSFRHTVAAALAWEPSWAGLTVSALLSLITMFLDVWDFVPGSPVFCLALVFGMAALWVALRGVRASSGYVRHAFAAEAAVAALLLIGAAVRAIARGA